MNKITIHYIIIVLMLMTASSCTSKKEYYDYTNLHQYTPELEADFYTKEALNPPYAALFDTQDNKLLYIAADHTIDKKSETFSLINKAFKEYQPDFVIIEGLEENRGESPQKLIDHIYHTCLPGSTCGEGLWAAHLSTENKLKFIVGSHLTKRYTKLLQL